MSQLDSGKLSDLSRLHNLNEAAPGLNLEPLHPKPLSHPPDNATCQFSWPWAGEGTTQTQNLRQVITAHTRLALANPAGEQGISIASSYFLCQHPTNPPLKRSQNGAGRTQETGGGYLSTFPIRRRFLLISLHIHLPQPWPYLADGLT